VTGTTDGVEEKSEDKREDTLTQERKDGVMGVEEKKEEEKNDRVEEVEEEQQEGEEPAAGSQDSPASDGTP
jgi:hypothetical protein